jgi:hypothetical protein
MITGMAGVIFKELVSWKAPIADWNTVKYGRRRFEIRNRPCNRWYLRWWDDSRGKFIDIGEYVTYSKTLKKLYRRWVLQGRRRSF